MEQATENPRVGGSIPPLATKYTDLRDCLWFEYLRRNVDDKHYCNEKNGRNSIAELY